LKEKTITKEKNIEELNCAEIVVKSLEDLGVDTVFGYTGGMILPVFDALSKSKIKVIVNSNEQSSAFSAAGYSRSTNKVGVAIVTSGPGITNTLTSVADAFGDSIPLLIIAGQVPASKIGTDAFQHIDVESIFKKASKKVISINGTENIEKLIKNSYFESKSKRPGPIVIDFPFDKQLQKQTYNKIPLSEFENEYLFEQTISDEECELFFDELKKSKSPLLYIGGGINNEKAAIELNKFNLKMKIPIVNTLMGKGIISNENELHLGMLGMFGNPSANIAITENDFFFAIGVRWDDRVADKVGSFGSKAKIAYIDINFEKVNEISIERKPFLCIHADATKVLQKLNEYLNQNKIELNIDNWRKKTNLIKNMYKLGWNDSSSLIQQAHAIYELNKQITEEDIIVTGVGNHQMFSAQYISSSKPKKFITSGAFGTMGFPLPTSIGVQIANPTNKVIVIDGDGGAKMNFGELNTIATLNLPIKIIILNNYGDGMVRNLQDVAYSARMATTREKSADFEKIAKALGFSYTKKVTKKEDLIDSIKEILNSKESALLEIITDPEEILYPKVPQGKSYSEMILGPHMKINL
jgi:acetolactate synthase I/II/III large subunit